MNITGEVDDLARDICRLGFENKHPPMEVADLTTFLLGSYVQWFGAVHVMICVIRGVHAGLDERQSIMRFISGRFSDNFAEFEKILDSVGNKTFISKSIRDLWGRAVEFRHDFSHGFFGTHGNTQLSGIFRPRSTDTSLFDGLKPLSLQDILEKVVEIRRLIHLLGLVCATISSGQYELSYVRAADGRSISVTVKNGVVTHH
jgi:hypothetical protein